MFTSSPPIPKKQFSKAGLGGLKQDLEIAKGLALIGEEVIELHFAAREQVVEGSKAEIYPHLISS